MVKHPNVPKLTPEEDIVCGTTAFSPVLARGYAYFRARMRVERLRLRPCCPSQELLTTEKPVE